MPNSNSPKRQKQKSDRSSLKLNEESNTSPQTDYYISPNQMWAVIPWGKKYVSVYNGEQICTHLSLETGIKFIKKEMRKSNANSISLF